MLSANSHDACSVVRTVMKQSLRNACTSQASHVSSVILGLSYSQDKDQYVECYTKYRYSGVH